MSVAAQRKQQDLAERSHNKSTSNVPVPKAWGIDLNRLHRGPYPQGMRTIEPFSLFCSIPSQRLIAWQPL